MVRPVLLSCVFLGTVSAQVWPPPPPWWSPAQPQPTTTSTTRTTTTSTRLPPGATQSLWGQCGGMNWDGPTRCPIGAYCKNDGNIWYEQCVPIETGTPATTRTSTTTITSGPVVITTYITYVTPTTTPPPRTSIVTVTLRPDEPCDHPFLC
ncbi:hypothetical protein VTJ04DRAFT_8374 [Mycothermus thermophilus]|uniref:uncharacterized protein n=1 Tax=Humicola insolens TaxID=85995 RepID=UPI0037449901